MNISNYSCKYFGNNEALASYLNDIRKYQVPTVDEEVELFNRIKNGDNSARDEIIQRNQRFVYAIAKIYARNEDEVLDYVSEGNIGLMEAIDSFDVERGFKFISYAVLYMRREMNYYMHNTNKTIRRSSNLRFSKKVDVIKDKFYNENGYMPTDEDIVEILNNAYGANIKDVSDISDITVSSINSYMDDEGYTLEDDDEYNQKTKCELLYEGDVETNYNGSLVERILDGYKNSLIEERCNYDYDLRKSQEIANNSINILKMFFGIGYERIYSIEEISSKFHTDPQVVNDIKNNALEYIRNKVKLEKMAV